MDTKISSRRYDIDWMRVFAILTIFVYHSTRFFNNEDWHVKNPIPYPLVDVWNAFASNWMMLLIFTISGASLFYALGKGRVAVPPLENSSKTRCCACWCRWWWACSPLV